MALGVENKEYFTFVRGLITEANPFTFPENASLDEDNFELLRDGSRRRRLGLDYESGHLFKSTGIATTAFDEMAVNTFVWASVNDNPVTSILVVQIGTKLWFFDLLKDSPSAGILNGGNAFDMKGDPKNTASFSSVFGRLFVVNGQKGFYIIDYDSSTDSISATPRLITVRDIWGLDDGLAVNREISSLSGDHEYNLVNQGWAGGDPDLSRKLYYIRYYDNRKLWPSNAAVVSAGKDPTSGDKFVPIQVERTEFGTTPAPKGFVFLDAFRRGASRNAAFQGKTVKSTPTIINTSDPFNIGNFIFSEELFDTNQVRNSSHTFNNDETLGGLVTTTSYAGRAWFAGASSEVIQRDDKSPNLGGAVFFSQIVQNDDNSGKCHQDGDPTSEDNSDLLETDGGVVFIPEARNINYLKTVGRHLLVFAENGLWTISGGEENFTATGFEVSKISDVGTTSPEAVVSLEGFVMFWASPGIYIVQPDQVTGQLGAQNLSETTIQTFYNDIPSNKKCCVKAFFDGAERKVKWLFSDDDAETTSSNYNRELVFDIVLQAFYTKTFSPLANNSPWIGGAYESSRFNSETVEDIVVVNGDTVVVNSDPVTVSEKVRTSGKSRTKYLIFKDNVGTIEFTFGELNNNSFVDWETEDGVGVDAPAKMVTGYEILGDSQRNKQAVYLSTHFERTESGFEDDGSGNLVPKTPSSCLAQAQWDFADSTNYGKWSKEFQTYKLNRHYVPSGASDTFDYGRTVITTKNKIRGRGKALSLQFKTEPEKDCRLYGWGVVFTGNTNV